MAADGPATDIVRTYITQEVQDRASADLKTFRARTGSGEVLFTGAELVNERGEIRSDYFIGDDLIIQLHIETRVDVGSLCISVTLMTDDGIRIANMVDHDSGFTLGTESTGSTLRVTMKDIRLYPGRYIIGFGLSNPAGTLVYDYIEECLVFNIQPGGNRIQRSLPRTSGLILLTPSWELVR